jgi:HAD superfamily hydrolase (TIGR01490 family)
MPRKAAFFDIDGTLIKGLIICTFPVYLARKGFFDKQANDKIQELLRLYKTGKASYRDISLEIPKLYAAGAKGQRQAEIRKLASDFMKEYRKNILPYSKGLVSLMNNKGFFTMAVSGSPIEAILALDMGFREIQGTEMELRNGIYTGRVKRNLIIAEEKRKVITSLIRKYGIDLKGSFAFGDTEQDLAMLSRVGHPVPLNPTPLLRQHALREGWCIPKDVLKEVKELL